MKASVIVLSIIVLILASQCLAGSAKSLIPDTDTTKINGHVKFALHLAPHGTYTCKKQPTISIQGDIVNNLDAFSAGVDAFMVVFDYDSLKVVEWGLSWPSEWGSASTFICVANPISVGGIVNPGDGIAISWGDPACRIPNGLPGGNTAPFFIPAYSYLIPTGTGQIEIWDDPPTTSIGVSSCGDESQAVYSYVMHVYYAGILMSGGGIYDGGPTHATEPTTWGAIKSVFK
jgi:hypothetical protein